MRAIAARVAIAAALLLVLVAPRVGLDPAAPARPAPTADVPGGDQPGGAPAAPTTSGLAEPSEAGDPTAAATAGPDGGSEDGGAPAGSDSAIAAGSVNRTSIRLRATYNVYARLNYDTRILYATTTIRLTNTSGGPIDRVELNTIATRLGNFQLRLATVDGRSIWTRRRDQTLVVGLGGNLPAGESAVVRVGYRAVLRSDTSGSNWLFTRSNGIVSLYRWIPWISRQRPFDRPNHGDPFITPVSPEVRVRIRTNRPVTFATTGERVAVDGRLKTFVARNVRDFTVTASPTYRSRSAVVGNNVVRVLYRPGAAGLSMLSAAKRALSRMEALVGPYPYRTFRVAQSSGGYGMESPGIIWIPGGVPAGNLSYLVHHETAHQWFYSLVGNDQAREPFADEAAADFLARYTLGLRRGSRCSTGRLDLSIYSYSSTCYYEIVYIQGGNFLDDIRRLMGSRAFWRGIRDYVADQRFRLTTTRTLLETLDAHTSLNLDSRFAPRFPRLY